MSGSASSTTLSRADEFVEYACLTFQTDDSVARRRRAERVRLALPNLANESFLAAVVLGDVAAVQQALTDDPSPSMPQMPSQ